MKRFGLFLLVIQTILMTVGCGETRQNNNTLTTDSLNFTNEDERTKCELTMDWPTDGQPALVNAIREYICDKLDATYSGDINDPNLIKDNLFKKAFQDCDPDPYDDDAFNVMGSQFVLSFDISKVCETSQYVTYHVGYYAYYGGAHGNYGSEGMTFRKSDGKCFGKDMLYDTYDEGFRQLLKKGVKEHFMQSEEFRANDENNDDGDISDEDLGGILFLCDDVNNLPIPDTAPFLTPDGVTFIYQTYEISSYAAGMIVFTIPYDEMSPYLTATTKKLLQQ